MAGDQRRTTLLIRFLCTALALLAGIRASVAAPLCAPLAHEGARYTVCTIDLTKQTLALYWGDKGGVALGSLDALAANRKKYGETLLIGMNAGMYDPDLKPVGLYVEHGRQVKAANTADGFGNFHLKPNGIFYLAGGKAGVLETQAFLRSRIRPEFATQSGPMLVIDGKLHPRFGDYAKSMKIRNGVGIGPGGLVLLVISQDAVTFPQFASLFRDALRCRNALYLDGSVSSLTVRGEGGAPALDQGGYRSLGPLIGVTAR